MKNTIHNAKPQVAAGGRQLAALVARFEERRDLLVRLGELKREVEALERSVQFTGCPAVNVILDVVCEQFGVGPSDISGPSRAAAHVVPRHVVFYLCRELSDVKLAALGKRFSRDHGSVLYAAGSVRDRMTCDGAFADTVKEIQGKCVRALSHNAQRQVAAEVAAC